MSGRMVFELEFEGEGENEGKKKKVEPYLKVELPAKNKLVNTRDLSTTLPMPIPNAAHKITNGGRSTSAAVFKAIGSQPLTNGGRSISASLFEVAEKAKVKDKGKDIQIVGGLSCDEPRAPIYDLVDKLPPETQRKNLVLRGFGK